MRRFQVYSDEKLVADGVEFTPGGPVVLHRQDHVLSIEASGGLLEAVLSLGVGVRVEWVDPAPGEVRTALLRGVDTSNGQRALVVWSEAGGFNDKFVVPLTDWQANYLAERLGS